jgi:hypothetical protein
VAASTGMVLARPESPLVGRYSEYSSPSPPLNSRNSVSPLSSQDSSPFTGTRASVTTPNTDTHSIQTTGWVNTSPQKKTSPPHQREDTPLSSASVNSTGSSGRKPHKLKRRRSSKTPPLFGWRAKSKSPPVEEAPPTPPPVTIHHEEHYHLYDIGTRVTRHTPNPRHSIASIRSISGSSPRTPLKRIYPPPQKKDSPRLISPNLLCQVESCNGTPQKEPLLISTLRRMTSDGSMSPSRRSGHRRNQSVPSFDTGDPNTPTPLHKTNGFVYDTPSRSREPTVWLVSDRNTPSKEEKFGSQVNRRLDFGSQHTRKTSGGSSYAGRMSSQSPPATIPERCDGLDWDSESDPTYESMKMEQDPHTPKARISSVFDETDSEKANIPDHKAARTVVRVLPNKTSEEDLDWGDMSSPSKGRSILTRRMPSSMDVRELHIPTRTTSLSRSKSVPPIRPDASPERVPKRLSGISRLYTR